MKFWLSRVNIFLSIETSFNPRMGNLDYTVSSDFISLTEHFKNRLWAQHHKQNEIS